jgi:hypothetical protein
VTAPPRTARPFLATLAVALAAAAAAPAQPVAGQIDDFQDGTTRNWTNGFGATDPTNQPGGPTGASDRFLQFTSRGGFGGGSKLIIFNRSQWGGGTTGVGGNYVAAGITAVEMDLKAIIVPTTDPNLHFRIALKTTADQLSPGYESTTPFDVAADGAWHHFSFLLDTGHLTAVNNPLPLDQFLTSVGEFRILSAASTLDLQGDAILATAGVDNIHAVSPIPEPGSLLLALAGAVALGGAVRKVRGKR